MKKLLGLSAVAVMLATGANAAEEPRIVPHKLDARVHVLYGGNGMGANVGLILEEDGILLVDAMRDRTVAQLAAEIAKISSLPVTTVINTHSHEDHASGNGYFAMRGAKILVQKDRPGPDEVGMVRFDGVTQLDRKPVKLTLYPVLSHMTDDTLVFLPDQNVLFMGDTFTTNWHPTFYAGGVEGQMKVIAAALELIDDKTVIVPGHGAVTDRTGLIRYRDAFGDWMARMRLLNAKGASADDMQADEGLRAISLRFLQDGSNENIREKGYRRFIERTLSTELMPVDKAVLPHLANYVGDYVYDDGMSLRVELRDGALQVYEGGDYSGHIIPLSATDFHFPGRLEGEGRLTFSLGSTGKAVGATYSDQSGSVQAKRTGG